MHNVWIVDDEPFILDGLASLVDWPSLKLVLAGQAENGVDALEQIEQHNIHIDILITDIAMPEMNGLELLRVLKSRNPELKCIILSGYNEFDYIRQGMQLGIENYLLKPIHFEELTQTLINAVEKLNRAKIDRLDQDQRELLKDNILYRWVTGRIGKEQWKLRSDFLQLRLNVPSMTTVIIKPAAEDAVTFLGQARHIRRMAATFLEESGCAFLLFQNIDDHLVLVLDADCRSFHDDFYNLHDQLGQFAELLGQTLHLRPIMAVGSVETDFERVPISYQNALLALEYELLFPHEKLLDFERVTASTGPQDSALSDSEGRLRLPSTPDDQALHQQIDDCFAAFSHIESITPAMLRHAVVELIIQMKKWLNDCDSSHPVFQTYHDVMSQISTAPTLEQLKELVHAMGAEVSQVLSLRMEKSPVIRQVLEYVHRCYMNDFSLKTLGQSYRIHPVYLGQLFQKETHQSFSDYVNRFRIEKAMDLMKTTTLKTQDIAKAVGYWDTAHFYKHFKKVIGVAPAQYRKLL
ncbi:response regulator transcription factor [Paenibacillus alba]|uniref:response regulator n=1 Tax=Paenibacillus alba TaxID=1197127 RepID=UPI001565C6F6|nr:response regulator [Paenibacillus alba]NQX71828.1 response regulator transcription factor [Paenibacillus alba]